MPITTVDSVQYFVVENGHGPLVILGHSDASSSGQWRKLIEGLAGEFRLRAFDSAGQGRSQPWPEGRPYCVAAESRIVDVLADSEVAPFHLVGHSAGGMFLLDAALRLGSRVASLTLLEPVTFSLLREAGKDQAWAEVERVAETFQRRVHAGQPENAMAGFVDYWTVEGAWAAMPEPRRAAIVSTSAKICLQWDACFNYAHDLAAHSRLECPTLLIRGTETTLAARSVVDVLHATLPNCKLVEIEGAGHMCPVTHPDVVNPHIANHLRRHAGR